MGAYDEVWLGVFVYETRTGLQPLPLPFFGLISVGYHSGCSRFENWKLKDVKGPWGRSSHTYVLDGHSQRTPDRRNGPDRSHPCWRAPNPSTPTAFCL